MAENKPAESHSHQKVAVRTWCLDCEQELGTQEFNRADLEEQQMAELPDREAMSLVNANLAVPINIAAALNVLSDGSLAAAGAQQNTPIDQSQGGGLLGGLPTGS